MVSHNILSEIFHKISGSTCIFIQNLPCIVPGKSLFASIVYIQKPAGSTVFHHLDHMTTVPINRPVNLLPFILTLYILCKLRQHKLFFCFLLLQKHKYKAKKHILHRLFKVQNPHPVFRHSRHFFYLDQIGIYNHLIPQLFSQKFLFLTGSQLLFYLIIKFPISRLQDPSPVQQNLQYIHLSPSLPQISWYRQASEKCRPYNSEYSIPAHPPVQCNKSGLLPSLPCDPSFPVLLTAIKEKYLLPEAQFPEERQTPDDYL